MNQGRSTSLRMSSKHSNLVPKDLSDSLGKVPPQAPEFEEAVLGAILMEYNAYTTVQSILRPSDFYLDVHKEIYQAIVDLRKDNKPSDVRHVTTHLKKTGKLELVGGMYYLASLTQKVINSATIESDALYIKEQALRREAIKIAHQIQSDSFDDTKDVLSLLDSFRDQFEQLKATGISEPIEAKIKSIWKEVMLDEEPEKEIPILYIDNVIVGTAGNHSLVTGKKKSRKTLFLVLMISWYLKLPGVKPESLIFFDTEQGKHHVWQILVKVQKMTGIKIKVVYLRGRSPQERRDIIEHTLQFWESSFGCKPRLIFIDGIRDCLSNINDIDECTDTIVWLEKLTLLHNIHVCNVLHLNKGDNNARGHIGTELANKAQTSIMLELDEKNHCTKVICESSRDEPFQSFAFTHSIEKLPEVVGMPTQDGNIMPKEEQTHLIKMVFEDGPLSYGDLIEQVKVYFKRGDSKAKQLIADWHKKGWIAKSGPARSRDVKYSLITTSFAVLPPAEPPPPITSELDFGKPITDEDMPF